MRKAVAHGEAKATAPFLPHSRRDRRDQDDALWHRFFDSIHKPQERSQSPHGDPEVYRALPILML